MLHLLIKSFKVYIVTIKGLKPSDSWTAATKLVALIRGIGRGFAPRLLASVVEGRERLDGNIFLNYPNVWLQVYMA